MNANGLRDIPYTSHIHSASFHHKKMPKKRERTKIRKNPQDLRTLREAFQLTIHGPSTLDMKTGKTAHLSDSQMDPTPNMF